MTVVPAVRAERPDAASSVAPVPPGTGPSCVLASERAAHSSNEGHIANPS
jgi:hypothetical protein